MKKIRNIFSILLFMFAILFVSSDSFARDGTVVDIKDDVDVQQVDVSDVAEAAKSEIQTFTDRSTISTGFRFEIEQTEELQLYKFLYVNSIQNIPINDETIHIRTQTRCRDSPSNN